MHSPSNTSLQNISACLSPSDQFSATDNDNLPSGSDSKASVKYAPSSETKGLSAKGIHPEFEQPLLSDRTTSLQTFDEIIGLSKGIRRRKSEKEEEPTVVRPDVLKQANEIKAHLSSDLERYLAQQKISYETDTSIAEAGKKIDAFENDLEDADHSWTNTEKRLQRLSHKHDVIFSHLYSNTQL